MDEFQWGLQIHSGHSLPLVSRGNSRDYFEINYSWGGGGGNPHHCWIIDDYERMHAIFVSLPHPSGKFSSLLHAFYETRNHFFTSPDRHLLHLHEQGYYPLQLRILKASTVHFQCDHLTAATMILTMFGSLERVRDMRCARIQFVTQHDGGRLFWEAVCIYDTLAGSTHRQLWILQEWIIPMHHLDQGPPSRRYADISARMATVFTATNVSSSMQNHLQTTLMLDQVGRRIKVTSS